jgi:hypothetical protein
MEPACIHSTQIHKEITIVLQFENGQSLLTQSIQSTQIRNPVNCTAMHWVRRVTYLRGAGRHLDRAVELSSDVAADEPRQRRLWRRLDFLLLRTADRTY